MIVPVTSQEAQFELTFDNFALSGLLKRFAKQLTGRSSRLQSLMELMHHAAIENRHEVGLRTVPVHQIKGTLDRMDDFDGDFHPIREGSKDRWVRIAKALYDGKSLPPIELIQVGEVYYVVDGHHRVSVARAIKQRYIDAVVTVWTLRPTEVLDTHRCTYVC